MKGSAIAENIPSEPPIIYINMLKKLLTLFLLQCAITTTFATNYLTFTAEEEGSSFGIINYHDNNPDVQYSLDGGETWTQ